MDSPLCQFCHKEAETIEHALVVCPWTAPIWFGSQLQLTPNELNVQRLDSWILQQRIGLMATLLWQICKNRNDSVFGHENPDAVHTLCKATMLAAEYLRVHLAERNHSSLASTRHSRVSWHPPPVGVLKCNVDAAYSSTRQVGVVSAIIRDNQGRVITGKAKKIHSSSSLAMEAFALREGLILARSYYCEQILVESDCSLLVDSTRKILKIAVIVEDVVRLKNSFDHCGLLWTGRETNEAAYWATQAALSKRLSVDWYHNFPVDLNIILAKDRAGL